MFILFALATLLVGIDMSMFSRRPMIRTGYCLLAIAMALSLLAKPARAGELEMIVAVTTATANAAADAVTAHAVSLLPGDPLLDAIKAPAKAVKAVTRARRGHMEKVCPGNGQPCQDRWVWDEPPLAEADCRCGPECECDPCECPHVTTTQPTAGDQTHVTYHGRVFQRGHRGPGPLRRWIFAPQGRGLLLGCRSCR